VYMRSFLIFKQAEVEAEVSEESVCGLPEIGLNHSAFLLFLVWQGQP
jgi:hypothetical protein